MVNDANKKRGCVRPGSESRTWNSSRFTCQAAYAPPRLSSNGLAQESRARQMCRQPEATSPSTTAVLQRFMTYP
ncbi:hypothetical protein DPEC_G00162800 [Dallia pectoralis]|uniref:Uncharacterized protein n=1 Tax=Dallia pectoralis TaxID=75939 RepID=A0ACC2GGL8_DALPE|nr:hypothetical protein DPEC_G00162800 [Dallia pectoralis]